MRNLGSVKSVCRRNCNEKEKDTRNNNERSFSSSVSIIIYAIFVCVGENLEDIKIWRTEASTHPTDNATSQRSHKVRSYSKLHPTSE